MRIGVGNEGGGEDFGSGWDDGVVCLDGAR